MFSIHTPLLWCQWNFTHVLVLAHRLPAGLQAPEHLHKKEEKKTGFARGGFLLTCLLHRNNLIKVPGVIFLHAGRGIWWRRRTIGTGSLQIMWVQDVWRASPDSLQGSDALRHRHGCRTPLTSFTSLPSDALGKQKQNPSTASTLWVLWPPVISKSLLEMSDVIEGPFPGRCGCPLVPQPTESQRCFGDLCLKVAVLWTWQMCFLFLFFWTLF